MLPQTHFLAGLIVSLALYFGFDVGALNCFIFLAAAVLIDVDHYLYYVYIKKDWSLRRAVDWFMRNRRLMTKIDVKARKEFCTGFCFLHGIEVLVLLGVLGYFVWGSFYFIGFGFLLHLILDYIDQIHKKYRFDKFSVIYDYYKYGKLKFVDELEELAKLKK